MRWSALRALVTCRHLSSLVQCSNVIWEHKLMIWEQKLKICSNLFPIPRLSGYEVVRQADLFPCFKLLRSIVDNLPVDVHGFKIPIQFSFHHSQMQT